MRETPTIIFAGDTGWKVSNASSLREVPVPAGATPTEIASAIIRLIDNSSGNATLVISASWCLSATVSLVGIPTRNRRTSLLYRLELLLPLAAEDIAADYILSEPDTALAICVSTAKVKPIVDALEAAGIAIQSIVPGSIIAVRSFLDAAESHAYDAVIWQSEKSIEAFTTRGGIIVGWYVFPAIDQDLLWHVEHLFPGRAGKYNIAIRHLHPTMRESLQTNESLQLTSVDDQTIEEAAVMTLAAGLAPVIELRRDGLAPGDAFRTIRKPLREALIASMIFVTCLCTAACWRATRLQHLAAGYRHRQADLYREVFPGHGVPGNIVSRLGSEERRLTAHGGTNADAAIPNSALPTLQAILTGIDSLPADAAFQVDDLKVEDGRFSIEGYMRNRGELTEMTNSLSHLRGLQVDPPQTEQVAGKGLHVTLTGINVVGETFK